MRRISINISDEMADYAAGQVRKGRFPNVDDFFEKLVRFDHEERLLTLQELHEMLDDAEASGVSDRSLSDIVNAAKAELKRREVL